jgi:uncharacterized protein (TIGR00369 family)
MPQQYCNDVRKPGQTVNPLFAFLGVGVAAIADGSAELTLPLRPEFIQGAGVIAGGILATLLDEAMAHAVIGSLAENQATATIQMSCRFLRAVSATDCDKTLRAEATLAKRGRRIAFAEATAFLDKDPIAKAEASFLIIG